MIFFSGGLSWATRETHRTAVSQAESNPVLNLHSEVKWGPREDNRPLTWRNEAVRSELHAFCRFQFLLITKYWLLTQNLGKAGSPEADLATGTRRV